MADEAARRTSSWCGKPAISEVIPVRPKRFKIGEETSELLKHLDIHGYAVAGSVAANPDEVEHAKGLLWDFMEGHTRAQLRPTGVRRELVSTWGGSSSSDKDNHRKNSCKDCSLWLGNGETGIISGSGIGQAPFMWYLRLLLKVSEVFAAIWGVTPAELLCSFDGANIFRPWQFLPEWKTRGGWYHVDQNAYNKQQHQGNNAVATGAAEAAENNDNNVDRCCCVQGLITLCSANEQTGGLVVIPGSHTHFLGVCERNAEKPRPGADEKVVRDFVRIKSGDEVLTATQSRGTYQHHLVCAEPGDLILWDSRTVHCNMPALVSSLSEKKKAPASPPGGWAPLRMVGYVCMTPATWATEDVLRKRWDAFIYHATTTHWPHKFVSDGGLYECRILHAVPKNNPATISEQQRRLIGGWLEPPVVAEDSDSSSSEEEESFVE